MELDAQVTIKEQHLIGEKQDNDLKIYNKEVASIALYTCTIFHRAKISLKETTHITFSSPSLKGVIS